MKRPLPATTPPPQPIAGAAALVCAWCGAPKDSTPQTDLPERSVSHGLCRPCARRLTRRRIVASVRVRR